MERHGGVEKTSSWRRHPYASPSSQGEGSLHARGMHRRLMVASLQEQSKTSMVSRDRRHMTVRCPNVTCVSVESKERVPHS